MKEIMRVTLPADKKWALALRMAAGGAGAVCDLPLDVMDDMRFALDEAYDLLTHQPYKAETLTLICAKEPGRMTMELCACLCPEGCGDALADAQAAHLIIGQLTTELTLLGDALGVRAVRMSFASAE